MLNPPAWGRKQGRRPEPDIPSIQCSNRDGAMTFHNKFRELAHGMNQEKSLGIVHVIGKDIFEWLSSEFNRETRLKDVPEAILDRVCSIDITIRDYARDREAITSIALITFAYKMAGKNQHPKYGSNDMLLLKVLAKNEKRRRGGHNLSPHRLWNAPLYELITEDVGETIRETKFMTNPL